MNNDCNYVFRKCKECGRILFINKFSGRKNYKFGKMRICKLCKKINAQEHYKNNRDKILKRQKKYYKDNKDKVISYQKEYYKENSNYVIDRQLEYYKDNFDHYKEYRNEYNKTANGRAIRFNQKAKRRYKEFTKGNGINGEQWQEMMYYFNWCCAYSGEYIGGKGGESGNRTIDHIVALNSGGTHDVWNLVPMHRTYNSIKQDQEMEEWYKQQVFYSEERLKKIYEWQKYAYDKWCKDDVI